MSTNPKQPAKGQKAGKNLNPWDRFWLTVKANEKIIWVVLLAILAPTFAFPLAPRITQSMGNRPVYQIFGKNVGETDLALAQAGLQNVARLYRSSSNPEDVLQFLIYLAEAERTGIRVSDSELGAAVRHIYHEHIAQQAAMEAAQKASAGKTKDPSSEMALRGAFYGAFSAKMEELEKSGEFDPSSWYRMLSERGIVDRKRFEDALRDVLAVEKLEEYVRNTVQATPEEAYEAYQKREQRRKFTVLEVRADKAREEVEKAITDAEVKEHYQKNRDSFQQPLKLRMDYLSLPVATFEGQVALTDEDLQKEYERVKGQKYQTFLGGQVEGGEFELLTPEETKARSERAFRPFEEVKEEVRQELLRTRMVDEAKRVAEKISERLTPRKPADAPKDAPPPQGAPMAEVAKEFPQARFGTTPWVSQEDAEKTLGPELYSPQVRAFFGQARQNAMERTKKEIDPPRSYSQVPSFQDPQHLVFYARPQVRAAGVPPLDEVQAKVRESLSKEKLLARARDHAKALAEAARDGKKTLEEAAKEEETVLHQSGFVTPGGSLKVPLSPDEAKKAEEEARARPVPPGQEPAEPAREKDHPGSRAILEFGFKSIQEKGKVDGFAEDPENAACYLVRLDDIIYPDPTEFAGQEARFLNEVRSEKTIVYLADWSKMLHRRANPTPVGRTAGDGE